ncbi:MAG TPA: Nif3-like dinuclear metal center hexameric protein [Sedimenticola sp.]|nr:Nif3-like dinuclear metal center hexameric protein [Sedimenticola sp.]
MTGLNELETYCNTLLRVDAFADYCPNGLQVDAGGGEVRRLVSGVSASLALIEAAAGAGADALLVHHGYFWKGEPAPLRGVKGRRIRALIQSGISLLAYHLPLDAHPELGNNRQLADRLGFSGAGPAEDEGGLIWRVDLEQPLEAGELLARISRGLGREPQHIPAGEGPLRRIGWCTGAAQDAIETAAALGLDAFVTGEISERTVHLARELGVHFFAAGHHATERFGVRALGEHLAGRFSLEHRFIDIPNPA